MVIPGREEGSGFIFSKREFRTISAKREGCHVYFLDTSLRPGNLLRQFLVLRSLVRQVRPALLHAQYGSITAFLCSLVKGQARLLVTYRGSDLNWNPGVSWLRNLGAKTLSYLAFMSADHAIMVSPRLGHPLLRGQGKTTVIPTGVDMNVFREMPVEDCRRRLGWQGPGPHLLLNVGKDPVNKRLDLAEAAHALLVAQGLPAELHVMRGQVDPADVPVWMNASDVVLMLSDKEGSPTVVQEALACGVPVVSVAVGDTPERLDGVESARLVERTPAAVAQAVKELVAVPRQVSPRVRAELGLESIGERILGLYDRLIRGAVA